MFRVPPASKHRDLGHHPEKNNLLGRIICRGLPTWTVSRHGHFQKRAAQPTAMVAVTLSSSSLASRAALARPKALKRNSRVALRVRAKLETEEDTAEKTDAPTTETGFLDVGSTMSSRSIWPGSDVASAFTAPKVNPAAKLFDANTMSEAERNALKRQYAQPTFLDGLFPKR